MAEAYKTNYFDPSGQMQTGYIIDGKTYKDEGGTTRVELGSIVDTADGFYTLTSSGGVKTDFARQAANSLPGYINSLKAQAKRQNEAMYQAKRAQLENQKEKINDAYLAEARNEYVRSMENKKNINQILKAQGIHGGMSESALLSNELAYGNNINNLMALRDSSLNDIDTQLLELRNETDYNILSDNMEYDKMYLEYADRNLNRMLEEMWAEKNFNSQNYFNLLNLNQDALQFDAELAERIRNNNLENERYYAGLDLDRYMYDGDAAQAAAAAARTYELNKLKANQSYSKYFENLNYDKAYDNAKILSESGDFSGFQRLYGWSDAQRLSAESNWRKEHNR